VRAVLHRVRCGLAGRQRHDGTALRGVHAGADRVRCRRSARLAAAVSSCRPKEYITMKAMFPFVMLVTAGIAGAESPSPRELLPELRKGGYVLFIRHPKTNSDQADTDPLHLDNVKAQRQLSDEGRKQAKALGDAFRALKIPV